MMNNLYAPKPKNNAAAGPGKSNAGEAIDISSDESGDDEDSNPNGKNINPSKLEAE